MANMRIPFMLGLHIAERSTWLLQLFISAFLAILFLQSGVDKIVDRRGNLEFLRGHFAKSPFSGMVPMLVTAITVLELIAGILTGVGCVLVALGRGSTIAFYGSIIAALSILCLFLGQRMAKDYAGAAVLVSYFLLCLAAIYLLA
jgi:uncharacterized membrane protein YphA (DoxX/SURF4 family)